MSISFLEQVAHHEQRLLVEVHQAEQEAARIIGQAHSQAARYLKEHAWELKEEIAGMRHDAEVERDRERAAILNAAETRLSDDMAEARRRVPQVAVSLVSLIVPRAEPAGMPAFPVNAQGARPAGMPAFQGKQT